MRFFKNSSLLFFAATLLLILVSSLASCGSNAQEEQAKDLVITEIMAANRTGLQNAKGKPTDWIEIKNNGKDTVNLEGFKLSVAPAVSAAEQAKDADDEDEAEADEPTWEFPEVSIAPGEYMVVFAKAKKEKAGEEEDGGDKPKKKDKKEKKNGASAPDKLLRANLKLPKEGGTVKLLSPRGKLISEVEYGEMQPDQAYARREDGSYELTYLQSPGFPNTREGYEEAVKKIDERRAGPILIWEVMSRASTSAANWVELKNVSDTDVSLSGYALQKKLGKKESSFPLPARTLKPGEFITFRLAGKKANPGNPLDATVKLGDAETIILTKDGKFVDGVCAKPTTIGGSVGRSEGRKGFFFYSSPTRNAENGGDARRFIGAAPAFNLKPGVYADKDTVVLRLADTGRKVRYTLDGREPSASSPLFGDSLKIAKSTVIRAFAEGDSLNLKSDIATATYILGVEHDLPVLNISVAKSDLYDFNSGIMADGPGYTEEIPHTGANYWKKWTKKAHAEFFDNKEDAPGFSTACGLAIFGGFSRFQPKKSLRLKFRHKYGNSKVKYDFFGDGEPMELEDLVVRAGGQDFNRCMLRDEFFVSLMQPNSPHLLTQKFRPVAVYINAEYYGLCYLREKIDDHFVARKLNVPADSINIIMSKYTELGSPQPYRNLMNYVRTHDLSVAENFQYVKNLVDLEGLIDFKIGEIYSGNSDVGNVRYVRSTHPKSDKKWHFVFYDLDATWVGLKPSAAYYLNDGPAQAEANIAEHNTLINRLLKNKEFRALFLERVAYHLANTFSEAKATAVFDNLANTITKEMEHDCARWPHLSYPTWQRNIETFREKFKTKPKVMLDDLRATLAITDAENKKYFSSLGY